MRMKATLSWRTSAALVIVATVVAALLAGRPLELSMLWDVAILAAIVGPPLTALLVVYYRHACLRALLRLFRQTRHLHRASPQTIGYKLCLAALLLCGTVWMMSHIITVYIQYPPQGARFVCFGSGSGRLSFSTGTGLLLAGKTRALFETMTPIKLSRGFRLLQTSSLALGNAPNRPYFFGRSRIRGRNAKIRSFLYVAAPYWGICGLVAMYPLFTLGRTYLGARRELDRHCENCHYNLTGNTSGVCPECGTQVEIEQARDASRTSSHGSSC